MKMPLDKILTDIIFAETVIRVESDMVAGYGYQCQQTPPLNPLMYNEIIMSSNKILTDGQLFWYMQLKLNMFQQHGMDITAYMDFIL
jgi:hypothetical protein